MKDTKIFIEFDATQFDINPDTCVYYAIEDENGSPILHSYTMEELETLDDERLASIMIGFR
jgi:hypothetical protein